MHILTVQLHMEGALQAAAPPGKPKGNLVISCAKWSGIKPVSATSCALPTAEAFTPEDVLLSPGIKTFLAGLGSGAYSNHCGITYSPSLCVQTTSSLAKERVCFFSISLQLESNVKSSHKCKLRDSCFLEEHRAKTWISSPSQHWGSSPPGGRAPASLVGHQSAWKRAVLTRSTVCHWRGIHPFALQQTSLLLPIVSPGQCGFSPVIICEERDIWCIVPTLELAVGFIWDCHCPEKLCKGHHRQLPLNGSGTVLSPCAQKDI